MRALDTPVQETDRSLRARLALAVTDPRNLGLDEVLRLLLDVPKVELVFIEQYAAFRNAVAAAQGKKLKRHWSRKSMAEQFLADQAEMLRTQLSQMFTEVGPFPQFDPDDQKANRAAMEKYAKRVVAWAEKNTKQ